MPKYNLSVLGFDISFTTGADSARVEQARILVEESYNKLQTQGKQLGKEKLLTFLALGMADELLQAQEDLAAQEKRMQNIVSRLDFLTTMPHNESKSTQLSFDTMKEKERS